MRGHGYDPAVAKRLVDLWNSGLTMDAIRRRLGVSVSTGWKMLDQAEAAGTSVTRRRRNGKHVVIITKPR